MKIRSIHITRLTIPMEPFVIATETCTSADNILIRIQTDAGISGVGECSPFPMLVGESQDTCFHVGQDLAGIMLNKDPLQISERMAEMDALIAFNSTIKSAFDMALHDIAAKEKGLPLYAFLGGNKKKIQTDLTIGINTPVNMAATAKAFVADGVRIIKVKLGKNGTEDIERIRLIREAVGSDIKLRVDANQGWDYPTALSTLQAIEKYDIGFCEQPMHHRNDHLLPVLKKNVGIPIMADESVFDHHDAERLIKADACSYINIKLAKSGGILEAIKIADTAAIHGMPCMLGGMVESRLALTAKVHLAMAHNNIQFYDLDTCLLGHLSDPVVGGARYVNYFLELDDVPGIGADIEPGYLKNAESITIQ
ncbi:MAG: mandelate racemase/muconate lactonizing enzyme family protein [Chitinophagia bacterium]|jgi:L-alanine-DL-glutamate epimerase-like enolase superfamily enzyme